MSETPDKPVIDASKWVERYGDNLWRFALSRVHQQEAAEELVQEALVSALASKDRFAGGSSELTWLTGVLNHKIMDYFRRKVRRPEVSLDAAGGSSGGGEGEEPLSSRFDETGHRVRPVGSITDSDRPDEQLLTDLADCKDALPVSLAEPFVLREVQGMDGPTICQVLGLTPTNLWTRLHRARIALRDCIELKHASRAGKHDNDPAGPVTSRARAGKGKARH